MACTFDLHPDRNLVDQRLKAGIYYTPLAKWTSGRHPELPVVSRDVLKRHRRDCLGLPPLQGGKTHPAAAQVPDESPKPKPSDGLGRDVTDEDIEQRMLRRFYDTIDEIAPEKIADLLIEREKGRNRGPVGAKSKAADVPADLTAVREAAARALGGRPSRTRTRIRAIS